MSESTNPIPPGSTPGKAAAQPAPVREKTPLDLLVSDPKQLTPLMEFLTAMAARRGARGAAAEDAISTSFVRAFALENKGEGWDPKTCVRLHMLRILEGELTNERRRRKRKPTEGLGDRDAAPDDGYRMADDDEGPTLEDDAAIERERQRRGEELLALCKAESDAGLGWRMVTAARGGIGDHDELATHLGCTVDEVRAARKRLDRRIARIVA
ncbi:MAG TPA: hypothetical protein VIY73_08465, partial [Polyangiaceae bacterium]